MQVLMLHFWHTSILKSATFAAPSSPDAPDLAAGNYSGPLELSNIFPEANLCWLNTTAASTCTSLSMGPGLTAESLEMVSGYTSLTTLSLTLDADSSLDHAASLAGLVTLPQLHDLTLIHLVASTADSALLFGSLTPLRVLCLVPASSNMQDFRMCTQLTALSFRQDGPTEWAEILAPKGTDVSLQHLHLASPCLLSNLQALTQMTYLSLCTLNVLPVNGNSSAIAWPCSLPSLKSLCLDSMLYMEEDFIDLPDKWQNYTGLQELILPPICASDLPSWFSKLQQLTHLELPMSSFPGFPKCLSQLQKLEHLAISGYSVRYTSDVIGLAQLPRLSHSELGEHYEEESDDDTGNGCPASDIENLELLGKALESRPLRLMQKHPGSYWNFSVSL